MRPEEKFMFDLEGYLVVKNVLTPAEVHTMNAQADQVFAPDGEEDDFRRTSCVSRWGSDFQNLIDHPKILPYLVELLGPKVRIDHDYCIFMNKGAERGRLHGGETDRAADHWYKYRDGIMRNGLTVATFFLTPAAQGDGGFCCIPGSHKSNFVDSLPDDVRHYVRVPHYVVQPAVEAGDALIFTEALIHGTMRWTADHERRALLYKYSPGHSAWSQEYYNLADYPNATEQQIRMMAPPSVGRRPDTVAKTSPSETVSQTNKL
ncbi:phytanoyl-CoA dioxygenase family protein [Chloroflexi bacterium TSY]|nr:phytanoyl-CoA dioxygenase family protein [Chloroflexi bacterium TSY]